MRDLVDDLVDSIGCGRVGRGGEMTSEGATVEALSLLYLSEILVDLAEDSTGCGRMRLRRGLASSSTGD